MEPLSAECAEWKAKRDILVTENATLTNRNKLLREAFAKNKEEQKKAEAAELVKLQSDTAALVCSIRHSAFHPTLTSFAEVCAGCCIDR